MKTTHTAKSPQSRRALERANEALAGGSFRTTQSIVPRSWWCLGDPQAGFDTFCAVLEHHGLLDDDGLLRHDVGLVSMGDHFDYGAGTHDPVGDAMRGLEGQRILAFLAAHPRSQVRILLGNHDAARVIEFAHLDDERFSVIKAASHAVPRNPADELRYALEYDVPCVTMPKRDFCTWSEAQRSQVERLLPDGRYDLAAVGVDAGVEILLTHTGVTSRELGLLGLSPTATAQDVAVSLNSLLTTAVSGVADAWRSGRHTPLSLEPLHTAPSPGVEAGGFLAHRPANPERPDPWGWDQTRPRRFAPSTLPRAFDQAVGHTGAKLLDRGLAPWSAGNVGPTGRAHTLFVDADACRFVVGVASSHAGSTRLLLLDPGLAHVDPAAVDLLPLESVV